MVDQRFNELREELLRVGVAARNVGRAVLEIENHFQQLIDEECGHGASESSARVEAHRRLGTNQVLVLRYAARPELHAWSRRWPSIWFMLLPLITYFAFLAATLMAVLIVAHHVAPYLHQFHIAPPVTHRIDLGARILLLWFVPLFVATAVAVLAYRRRAPLGWPLIGIVSISAIASLINVGVTFTGGSTPGEIGGGIGLSPESFPGQATRAALLASLTLVPLWLAARRAQRGYDMH
jgi:hypothetical protein